MCEVIRDLAVRMRSLSQSDVGWGTDRTWLQLMYCTALITCPRFWKPMLTNSSLIDCRESEQRSSRDRGKE